MGLRCPLSVSCNKQRFQALRCTKRCAASSVPIGPLSSTAATGSSGSVIANISRKVVAKLLRLAGECGILGRLDRGTA